jgi:hypothetical protein
MSKPLCIFQSPWGTRSGYGDWAEAIAKSLLRYDKFDFFLVPMRWGQCSKKNLQIELPTDAELQALVSKILQQPLNRQPDVFIQCSIPNEATPVGKFNILMTAGIESTIAAGPWIEGLNRMNFNISTSVHAQKIFQIANFTKNYNDGRKEILKLDKPCEVLFWGANTSIFKKTDVKNDHLEKFMSSIKENFAFLFVGQWTANNINADRKNIGMLIKTFIETFRGVPVDKRPCLILKTSGAALCKIDKYDCIGKLKSIITSIGESLDNPNVYILHGELTDTEMNALYNHEKVKVHVSFTRGEGFGHPLLLASLSGKPVLASNWSGHLDFLDANLCKLLPGELKQIPGEAVNDWFIKEAGWFDVNYPAAGEIMKNVFNHYDSYLPQAEMLRVINQEKFSIQAMDKVFHEMLDRVIPPMAIQQTINLPRLKKITLPKPPVTTPTTTNQQTINLPRLKKITLPKPPVTTPTTTNTSSSN